MVSSANPRRRAVLLVVVVMVVVVVSVRSSTDGNWTDCRVTESIQVPHPSEVPLLAYISGSTSVVLVLIYPGVKDADVRDAVNLTSTKAVHSKVRDGKSTKYPESLSWVIPEGWNTFTLLVADGSLTVTLVQNEDQVTLYTLTLEHTVNKMYAEGSVAHCQRASPEWEVSKGKEAKVLLQPGGRSHDQWMEVSARGLAAPYVTFPSSRNTKTPIPANTILRVAISLRGKDALLKLFKDGDGGGEEVVDIIVPVVSPMVMVVGCGDGGGGGGGGDDDNGIHLRLMLSPPTRGTTTVTNGSIGTGYAWIGMLLGIVVLLAVIVLGVVDVTQLRLWPWTARLKKLFRGKTKVLNRSEHSKESTVSLDDLSQHKDFKVIFTGDGRVKEVFVKLSEDVVIHSKLDKLRQHTVITQLELLKAYVPEPRKLCDLDGLPHLPDAPKVKLEVGNFKECDLAKVCRMVANLQPEKGYSTIDFLRCDMKEERWEDLLQRLNEKQVIVKGKVFLPAGALSEERHKLFGSITVDCRQPGL